MSPQGKLPSIAEMLRLGMRHHEEGRLCEAEEQYEQILLLEPGHADALNFSGIIAHQRGQPGLASSLISQAIRKEPRVARYYFNFGLVMETTGALDEAIAHYRQATLLDPDMKFARFRLGNALSKQEKFSEAAVSYSQELRVNPESHETINNLGSALEKLGRLQQAIVCFEKAISLQPSYAEAHNNLGVTYDELWRLDDAATSFRRAILYQPAFADAYSNLGNTLTRRYESEEAIEHCKKAIELEPSYAAAHFHLGNVYRQLGLFSDAVNSYQHAIYLTTDNGAIYSSLGETFKDQGRLKQAAESFEKAIAAKPVFAPAYSNLLYFYAFTRYVSPEEERVVAQGWEKHMLTCSERVAARERARPGSRAFPIRPRGGRKLRLGILIAELGFPGVCDFLDPLLDELDRGRFELTMFPTFLARAQAARDFAHRNGDGFVPLDQRIPAAEAAELIRSERIDVLLETTGHTYNNRLDIVAHRAAPVQCSYVGYWSTTGLTEMDWFITGTGVGPYIDAHFTERLWKLPRQAFCYKGDPKLRDDVWSPDVEGTVWLGSFNNNAKIREETLALWAKVLHAVPEARLLFEDRQLRDAETQQRLGSTLLSFGVDASRFRFIPHIDGHERHMSLFPRLDIALDVIPFNSVTTAFDSLWMGVPLVTIVGSWLGGTIAG